MGGKGDIGRGRGGGVARVGKMGGGPFLHFLSGNLASTEYAAVLLYHNIMGFKKTNEVTWTKIIRT